MTTLARAEVVIGGDDGPLQQALSRAESRMKRAGRRMQNMGRTLSTRVTLPLAAMGAASVKAFADFDSAMTQSLAIMGDVSDTMRNTMGAAARDVARTTTVSATQAAESYFFLASAGLDAEQSVAALPQVAAFAQAGMFDMATATDLATDAQSALGLAVDDAAGNLQNMTRVTDVLVRANSLANASVEQFATALTTEAGAAMKTFGQDVEEGVAVLAAFADQGIKGQRAGAGYSRVLRLMSQAAVNNKQEMAELGISFFDAQGDMRNMADVVENLTNALGPMSDEQRAAALESIGFSARVQGIIQPLLGTSAAIREYEAGLRDAAGTTAEVAANQMKSFSAQMKVTWNNVKIAGQAMGEVLAPAVARVANIIKVAAQGFTELSPTMQKVVIAVGALVAGVGPLLLALGTIVTLLPAITTGLAVLTGPVGLAVAAVAALTAAGVALVDNWGIIKFEVQRLVEGIRTWLVERFGRIVESVREKVDAIGGFFKGLYEAVVGGSYIPDMVREIGGWMDKMDQKMTGTASRAVFRLQSLFQNLATDGAGAFRQFANSVIQDINRIIARIIALKIVETVLSFLPGGQPIAAGINVVGETYTGANFGGFGQHGMSLNPGEWGVVGEAGPEIVTAGPAGLDVTPMDQAASAPSVNVRLPAFKGSSPRDAEVQTYTYKVLKELENAGAIKLSGGRNG